jgi:hypothetical protein
MGGYESTGFRFLKLDYVDRDLREQDFNLGHQMSVRFGISPRQSSSRPTTFLLRFSESDGHAFGQRAFVTTRFDATTRAPRNRNTILSEETRLVWRFDMKRPQTFVARARVDLGWQLDRDVQFIADGQNGLRAYPDFAFEGRRRLLINAEQRIFLGREILQIFGPSIALFVDSGQAVDHNFKVSRMKTDAGVGLRIGVARYESALIRIDYAWVFNSSPLNRRGHTISVSTMQAF